MIDTDFSNPSITVTRTGKALICQIGSKSYKITNLQRMLPGSAQWQNIDINDDKAIPALDALTSSIEQLINQIGPEQFDLKGAKSFQVVATRQGSSPEKPLPFKFHELVWKPPGAKEHSHFKLVLDNFDPQLHPRLQATMTEVGTRFAAVMGVSKVKTSSGKKSETFEPGFITPMRGDGNCLLHSIAHQIPDASAKQLRKEMADQMKTNRKFREDPYLASIVEAVKEERNSLQSRLDGAVAKSEQDRLSPQISQLDNILSLRGIQGEEFQTSADDGERNAIIEAYANYISQDGIYLDQPSIQALANVVQHPIAVISPELAPKTRQPTARHEICELFSPEGLVQGIEDPQTLFVYYHGRGYGGKHYDHVNPAHRQTKHLIQEHKRNCLIRLEQTLNSCDPLQQGSSINSLLDPISTIRKYYPELFDQIHNYLNTLGVANLPRSDQDLAQMLLQAQSNNSFNFAQIEALGAPAATSNLSPHLQDLKNKNAEQAQIFASWKEKNSWKTFQTEHYDWWAFPVTRPSAGHGSRYTVTPEQAQILLKDVDFMKNYRQGVEDALTALENNAQFPPVRIAKMGDSLKLFNQRDLHERLQGATSSKKFTGRDAQWAKEALTPSPSWKKNPAIEIEEVSDED